MKGRIHSELDIPCKHVKVSIGSTPSLGGGDIHCRLGHELNFDAEVLAAYCFREMAPIHHDLFVLAGAVAFADKIVPRRLATSWRRDLTITLPVYNPSKWSDPQLNSALIDLLGLLTGDSWHFQFEPCRETLFPCSQSILPLGEASVSVLPYSDGLDSFATARMFSRRHQDRSLILVTTGRRKDADLEWRREAKFARRRRISVPFRLSDKECRAKFREQSYRSRGFVFGVITAIATYLAEAESVIIPEAGQGALLLPLAAIGPEAPDFRTHPMFTANLSEFLNHVFGTAIRFEHPNIWRTKGEILRTLVDVNVAQGWEQTRSCSRDSRHMHYDGRAIQCGVCASCLLRRQSVMAAGLREVSDSYLWTDLCATTLDLAGLPGAREAGRNDVEQAKCGAFLLQHMARLGSASESAEIKQAAFDLRKVLDLSEDEVTLRIARLFQGHAQEWSAFVGSLGPTAFVASWLEFAA